jgi:hypothetical protein
MIEGARVNGCGLGEAFNSLVGQPPARPAKAAASDEMGWEPVPPVGPSDRTRALSESRTGAEAFDTAVGREMASDLTREQAITKLANSGAVAW